MILQPRRITSPDRPRTSTWDKASKGRAEGSVHTNLLQTPSHQVPNLFNPDNTSNMVDTINMLRHNTNSHHMAAILSMARLVTVSKTTTKATISNTSSITHNSNTHTSHNNLNRLQ